MDKLSMPIYLTLLPLGNILILFYYFKNKIEMFCLSITFNNDVNEAYTLSSFIFK